MLKVVWYGAGHALAQAARSRSERRYIDFVKKAAYFFLFRSSSSREIVFLIMIEPQLVSRIMEKIAVVAERPFVYHVTTYRLCKHTNHIGHWAQHTLTPRTWFAFQFRSAQLQYGTM